MYHFLNLEKYLDIRKPKKKKKRIEAASQFHKQEGKN